MFARRNPKGWTTTERLAIADASVAAAVAVMGILVLAGALAIRLDDPEAGRN